MLAIYQLEVEELTENLRIAELCLGETRKYLNEAEEELAAEREYSMHLYGALSHALEFLCAGDVEGATATLEEVL